jgi:HNH endonuclease
MDTKILLELFDYNTETGELFNKKYNRPTGLAVNSVGYHLVRVGHKVMYVHRVVWQMMTGKPPAWFIDHVNGDRRDNRWVNLRAATPAQNSQNSKLRSNNTSGRTGVYRSRGKWHARITFGGKRIFLGAFSNKVHAIKARAAAERLYFKEFRADLGAMRPR